MSNLVQVTELGQSTQFVGVNRGHDRVIAAAFTRVGARFHRAPAGRGWRVHPGSAADALAVLEADGHLVELTLG